MNEKKFNIIMNDHISFLKKECCAVIKDSSYTLIKMRNSIDRRIVSMYENNFKDYGRHGVNAITIDRFKRLMGNFNENVIDALAMVWRKVLLQGGKFDIDLANKEIISNFYAAYFNVNKHK